MYVTPNFQNPTGLLMSSRRRQALLDAAARHGLLILEDDPYGRLYFDDTTRVEDTRPIKADDVEGRVIYLGSISKTLVPGLRVAWLVAPAAIAQRVELAKQATDLCSGVFDQRVVHAALERGVVEALAPTLRAHYQRQAHGHGGGACAPRWAIVSAGRQPRGGFFLWAEFEPASTIASCSSGPSSRSVSFVIGSAFYVDGEGHRFARLSFSAPTPERIREGITRLARAVENVGSVDGQQAREV